MWNDGLVFRKNYAAGGGRTVSAKAMTHAFAETDCVLRVEMRTNVACNRPLIAFGAAECAATQTVHRADSVPLEWW